MDYTKIVFKGDDIEKFLDGIEVLTFVTSKIEIYEKIRISKVDYELEDIFGDLYEFEMDGKLGYIEFYRAEIHIAHFGNSIYTLHFYKKYKQNSIANYLISEEAYKSILRDMEIDKVL